jgi:hypothetical protein
MSINFNPITQALDGNGNPIAGAKYNFYEAGTSTRKDTFTTQAGDVAHANPVVADGNGYFAPIWLTGDYKEDLTDADDVSLAGFPVDNTSDTDTDLGFGLGFSSGLDVSNAADADHDITIALGKIMDSSQTSVISLLTGITKRIDAVWAAGTGNGGLPSALTLTADTWYRVFLIKNPDTGDIDAGFDTSITAANLIADAPTYTQYRRVSYVLTDGSSNILEWQPGNLRRYVWELMTAQLAGAGSASGASLTVQVPPSQIGIIMAQNYVTTAVTNYFLLSQTNQTNSAPGVVFQTVAGQSTGSDYSLNTNTLEVRVDSASNIRQRVSEAVSFVYVTTVGWIDDLEVF